MPILWDNIRKDIKERPCVCGKVVKKNDESTLTFFGGEFRLLHDQCYMGEMSKIEQGAGKPMRDPDDQMEYLGG